MGLRPDMTIMQLYGTPGTLFAAERGGFLSVNPSGYRYPALYLPLANVSGATVLGVQLTDNEDIDTTRAYDPALRPHRQAQQYYHDTPYCAEGQLITDFIHGDANTTNMTVGRFLYLAPNGMVTDDATTFGGVKVGTVWRPFVADPHLITIQGLGLQYTIMTSDGATSPSIRTFGPTAVTRTSPGWLGINVRAFSQRY